MKSFVIKMLLVAATGISLCAAPAMAEDAPDPGATQSFTFGSGATARPYLVYTPSTYEAGDEMPLVVMAHGCQTTAEQHLGSTQYNKVAEREGFVVAYPDVDNALTLMPGPLRNCWRFYAPDEMHRDQGDTAAIAGITQEVMSKFTIDPERVYLMGTSAGAFMTSSLAASYPDIYAAVGIMAGGAYEDSLCFGAPSKFPVETSAQDARATMGSYARIVPRLVMGGDADQGIPPVCADKALEQGLRTNNLVIGDSQTSPISLTPTSVREESNPNPGGYGSTVSEYTDPDGCIVGERWLIHGMNHFWSGGSSDPKWANWTDPKGPNGAEASWKFFSRYTKSDTSMPCAEKSPDTPVATTCPKHKLTLKLPRRSISAKATVNGKKAKASRKGRQLKLMLPATRRGKTVVVVKAKMKSGKVRKQRHTYKGCGPGVKRR